MVNTSTRSPPSLLNSIPPKFPGLLWSVTGTKAWPRLAAGRRLNRANIADLVEREIGA